MNTRLALYLSGAPYLVRHHYRKGGGHKVAILDRTRRWRAAARAMRAAGRSDLEIVSALGCSRPALARVLGFGWRF